MKRTIHFENLDGLRFFCFLAVFLCHAYNSTIPEIATNPIYHFVSTTLFDNGNLGVNFFFVLSGFLITYLLIKEKELNHKIDIVKFWTRRILRIWPLYFACVFYGFVVFPQIKILFGETPHEVANPFYYLFFLNNIDFIQHGVDSSQLGVLWSIAVEEQFYLVWPIILAVLPFRHYWIAFSAIILSSIVFRAYYNSPILNEFHTFSCMGDMAMGAMGAWMIQFDKIKSAMQSLPKWLIYIIYLFFGAIFIFRHDVIHLNVFVEVIERSVISIVILLIILEQNYSDNSFFKVSNLKTISILGTMTYGFYCLHFNAILIVETLLKKTGLDNELWQVLFLQPILGLIITVIIGKISYTYFEKPFLKLKEKVSFFSTKKTE